MNEKEKQKKNTVTKVIILMGVGFIIDIGQALIVYNAGKGAEAKSLGANYKWKMPHGAELLKTAGIVLATSILTGLIVSSIENLVLGTDEKEQIKLKTPS